MKKYLLFSLISLLSYITDAQVINLTPTSSEISVVYDCECPSQLKFGNAKEWAAKTFNNYKEAVQLEDKDNARLIIKGSALLPSESTTIGNFMGTVEIPTLFFTLAIDCKDSKYKVSLDDISIKIKSESIILMEEDIYYIDCSLQEYCEHVVSGETSIKDLEDHIIKTEELRMTRDSLERIDLTSIKKRELKKIDERIKELNKRIEKAERSLSEHFYWKNKSERRLNSINEVLQVLINSLNERICKNDDW